MSFFKVKNAFFVWLQHRILTYMDSALDSRNSVIRRLWCTSNYRAAGKQVRENFIIATVLRIYTLNTNKGKTLFFNYNKKNA